jgi:hypothetical protein
VVIGVAIAVYIGVSMETRHVKTINYDAEMNVTGEDFRTIPSSTSELFIMTFFLSGALGAVGYLLAMIIEMIYDHYAFERLKKVNKRHEPTT